MQTNKLIFIAPILFSSAVLANTPAECNYLKDSSLPTRAWVNHYDDEYGCSSDYLTIGSGSNSSLPNNIAYYVEGDSKSSKTAKLVLNINNKKQEASAKKAFFDTAQKLSNKIISAKVPNDILNAIQNGKNVSVVVGDKEIIAKRINWASGNGYETHIVFKLK